MDINRQLVFSAHNGFVDRVHHLVAKGASDFDSALMAASMNGHLHIVKFMIDKGSKKIDKALTLAVKYDHQNVFEYLIEKGGNINLAFVYASRYGRYHIMLSCMVKTNVDNLDIHFALSKAIKHKHRRIISLLTSLL